MTSVFSAPIPISPSPIPAMPSASDHQYLQPCHRQSLHPQQPRLHRYRQVKPDLAAPGVDVQGPALQSRGNTASTPVSFTRRTGASVAAAITAGAVACLFSWDFTQGNDTSLTSSSVRSILIRGADRKEAFQYPNRQWGYGTLNLYQAFLLMRE
ncbi:S8 family serine peptidase [Clostridium sp. OF09-36]|uniref:S8 family serine peptidase n=1 Tax=Clostridium sp. OF09-36 TaxID=2292310 RepID=UPI001FAA9C22|nr:S8 family serine peptidase [Clostridium sp. OF09-36]